MKIYTTSIIRTLILCFFLSTISQPIMAATDDPWYASLLNFLGFTTIASFVVYCGYKMMCVPMFKTKKNSNSGSSNININNLSIKQTDEGIFVNDKLFSTDTNKLSVTQCNGITYINSKPYNGKSINDLKTSEHKDAFNTDISILDVTNDVGDIKIEYDNSISEVVVHATKYAETQEDLDQLTYTIKEKSNSLNIVINEHKLQNAWINFHIKMPHNSVEVNVKNSSGKVEIEKLSEGNHTVTTHSGNINVNGGTSVQVNTSSGKTDINNINGDVTFDTKSAYVYGSKIKGIVTGKTTSGKVTMHDVKTIKTIRTESGYIEVTAQGDIDDIESKEGKVTIKGKNLNSVISNGYITADVLEKILKVKGGSGKVVVNAQEIGSVETELGYIELTAQGDIGDIKSEDGKVTVKSKSLNSVISNGYITVDVLEKVLKVKGGSGKVVVNAREIGSVETELGYIELTAQGDIGDIESEDGKVTVKSKSLNSVISNGYITVDVREKVLKVKGGSGKVVVGAQEIGSVETVSGDIILKNVEKYTIEKLSTKTGKIKINDLEIKNLHN